jgi:hypothetical protein
MVAGKRTANDVTSTPLSAVLVIYLLAETAEQMN